MVSERKKHEFVENKKSTADQYQGGTQPASPQNGWPEKEIKSNRKYQYLQGVFFTGPPPKKLKYGKLRLGEVTRI